MKKLIAELIGRCKMRNLNVSITYQRINNCSVEIYKGYEKNYEKIFYTDGHIRTKEAIKEAIKFLETT